MKDAELVQKLKDAGFKEQNGLLRISRPGNSILTARVEGLGAGDRGKGFL